MAIDKEGFDRLKEKGISKEYAEYCVQIWDALDDFVIQKVGEGQNPDRVLDLFYVFLTYIQGRIEMPPDLLKVTLDQCKMMYVAGVFKHEEGDSAWIN